MRGPCGAGARIEPCGVLRLSVAPDFRLDRVLPQFGSVTESRYITQITLLHVSEETSSGLWSWLTHCLLCLTAAPHALDTCIFWGQM